jgi:hypothetical protein
MRLPERPLPHIDCLCFKKRKIDQLPQQRKNVVQLRTEWYIAHEAYFYRRRSRMNAIVETSLEPRKEWATPELKKIDIDQITAGHQGVTGDANVGEAS